MVILENIKYTRIKYNNEEVFAEYENGKYYILDGSYFSGSAQRTGEVTEIAEILTPVWNNKIVAIGKNYSAHAAEMKEDVPTEPLMFLKPNTALLPHLKNIVMPEISKQVDYEAELAVVIGKTAKNIAAEEYKDYIFGYTCANDVTARDLQAKDKQWTRAKGFDTFLPIGPYIVKGVEAERLDIKLLLNGEVRQHSNTSSFIFGIREIVTAVARVMTLYPGDVILTGTPAGIGKMEKGDRVTVLIEDVGELTNYVE